MRIIIQGTFCSKQAKIINPSDLFAQYLWSSIFAHFSCMVPCHVLLILVNFAHIYQLVPWERKLLLKNKKGIYAQFQSSCSLLICLMKNQLLTNTRKVYMLIFRTPEPRFNSFCLFWAKCSLSDNAHSSKFCPFK